MTKSTYIAVLPPLNAEAFHKGKVCTRMSDVGVEKVENLVVTRDRRETFPIPSRSEAPLADAAGAVTRRTAFVFTLRGFILRSNTFISLLRVLVCPMWLRLLAIRI